MKRKVPSTFMLQQDQHDCGVACLRNILSWYKAEISLEKLREWSGSGIEGASLLGLHNAAMEAGFKPQGAKAGGVDDLLEVQHPCILHVVIDDSYLHYVVYYPGGSADRLLIGDPAKGLTTMDRAGLEKIWQTRTVLLLEPGERLANWQRQRQKKTRWLGQMLKEDMPLLYTALALGVICALLNLSTAIFSQQLVDKILPGKHHDKLYLGLAALALLLVIKSLFSFLRQTLLIRQGYQFNTRMTGAFYRSILYLNKFFFDHRKTGDLIARLNDTLRIQQAASYILGEMVIQFLMLLVTLSLLFVYSRPIGLFCLGMLPIVYGIVKYYEKDIILGQRSVMMGHAQNESNYVDSIRGIHTIKVMNREGLFAGIARDIFALFQGSVLSLGKIKIRFNFVLEITTALFGLVVIGWGGLDVWNGALLMGQLIAILQLAGMMMQTAVVVALTNLQVQEAVVALDRMYEFTILEPEYRPGLYVADGLQAPEGLREDLRQADGARAEVLQTQGRLCFDSLLMQQVGFRFPGRKLLLKDISLELNRGEIIALSGESGQGKSTILQVLQKFYPAEGGPIWVNEQELRSIDTVSWRRVIGVVPQEIAIFSGSLLANICLDHAPGHGERVDRFCREYGFDRYFEAFPQSYATVLGEGGVALSGGQRQLLALARCLYAAPQLVLLDEPTSAMDSATEQFVISVLRRYSKQAGLLVISHKDSLTEIADRVYRLESGVSTLLPKRAHLTVIHHIPSSQS